MPEITLPESTIKAGIDATGLHLPEYAEILEDLRAVYRTVYGDDVYLEADSQDGALVAILALRIHDCYQFAGGVYHSYAPSTAQGASLSSVVKVNGISRARNSNSHVDLRIVGQAGTIINNGAATDEHRQRWLLPSLVIIPVNGEITVNARAENPGDVRAAAGEITAIVTPVRGWQSVSNPAAAVPGAPVEPDALLRSRQRISTALPSRTVFEGTRGAVASLPGVTRHMGYENDTDKIDANGIPAHHICMVVEGGDTQAIADAVNFKKGPGCGTYGDVSISVYDELGVPGTINFFRSVDERLQAKIRIKPLKGYLASTGEAMRRNVLEHINSLDIGEDVLISKLYTPVNAAEPTPGQRTFDVLEIQLASKGGILAQQNMVISFKGAAKIELGDIEVEIA